MRALLVWIRSLNLSRGCLIDLDKGVLHLPIRSKDLVIPLKKKLKR